MGRNILFVILGVGALLLLSGCTSGISGAKTNEFNLGNSFKGGDNSLVFSFDSGMPPATVKDQGLQPFQVRIIVQNNGEFDIPANSSFVKLTGFDPKELNLNETSKVIPPIYGFKKQGSNERPGGRQAVIFNNLKYLGNVVSGTYNIDISANICYPYETKAIAEACISGNTVPGVDKNYQNCQIEGTKKFANSGAPVKIGNVKQFSNGQKSIQFQFDIIHKPQSTAGTVYAPGSIDKNCNVNGVSPTDPDAILSKDKVVYTVDAGLPINCEGTGKNTNEVVLANDKYTVDCVIDTNGQGDAYNKLINIKLDYDYMDRISKTLGVEHIQR